MLKKIALAAAGLCTAACCLAAEPATSATGLTPFVGIGLTFGGDQIGNNINYSDGSSSSLHAGGLVDLRLGAEYRASGSPLAFQFSAGYHADSSRASRNGSASFKRFPIEVLAHWDINEAWRVGGGLRKALNAESHASGVGTDYVPNEKFDSSVGIVLEAETFLLSPSFGVKIRAVSEKYKSQAYGNRELDGSHVGVIGVYYFR